MLRPVLPETNPPRLKAGDLQISVYYEEGALNVTPVYNQSTQMEVLAPPLEAKVMTWHMDHRFVAGSCCRIRIQWV